MLVFFFSTEDWFVFAIMADFALSFELIVATMGPVFYIPDKVSQGFHAF